MNLLTQLSKILFVILILLYSLTSFGYFKVHSPEKQRKVQKRQIRTTVALLIFGYGIIFVNTMDYMVPILGMAMVIYVILTSFCYRMLYPKSSPMLTSHMLMLLSIGSIMLARLDMDKAIKQFVIAGGATVIAFIIPVIIRKAHWLSKLTALYAILGIVSLMAVLALAVMSGGAKLSVEVGGITIQFSELVKITLVFFMASMLYKNQSFKRVVIATIIAAIHVGLLVLSTDLGSALIFFVTYLVMILAATRKPLYAGVALGGGSLAAVGSYFLFSHVRQRVVAWRDPFSVYDGPGYQIVQSMFAIGAGGWFGMGLCQGTPNKIPVAAKDFMFSAICEEFGCVFGICLILICMAAFLLIVSIALAIRQPFYKLIALGLGTEYAFQVFLTIGGVIKFIPMTGITLPLVSYGGSSVASTIVMLAIIQGLYMLREDEEIEIEKARMEKN